MKGENIISSTLSSIVLLSYKSIIQKSLIEPLSLRALYNPNPIFFLSMFLSTNTRSGPTSSTETTTPDPSNSYYVTQTDIDTTITDLCSKLDDSFCKLGDRFNYSVK